MEKTSPLMQQFFEIKETYGDFILFFRVGDFYEMFYDDALTASKELDLTLTGKNCGKEERAPMCGVPYHSCDNYIAKLIHKGYKVAICEQVEDPATAKGLVKREVTRIITPGTVSDSAMLTEDKNNFLACIFLKEQLASICFADISTGEIYLTSFDSDFETRITNELCKYMPSEVLMESSMRAEFPKVEEYISSRIGALITDMDALTPQNMTETICHQFRVHNLEQIHLNDSYCQQYCLFYLLYYIQTTQKCDISYLNRIEVYSEAQFMQLDISARKNLELVETMRSHEKKGSLLYVLDKTKSSMGARMLRSFLERPLMSVVEINRRLDAVEDLNRNIIERTELQDCLSNVYDLERLMTKVMYKSANPKDLIALKQTFSLLPRIKKRLSAFSSNKLQKLYAQIDELQDLWMLLENSIDEEASTVMRDGGYIRDGFNTEVDECRSLMNDTTAIKTKMETDERERTGIKNLKIGYNRVFGYYIEVTKAYYDLIPEDYIRKQTLLDKERFITQELKDLEYKIISAKDRLLSLEQMLFSKILKQIADNYYRIQSTAVALAELDVFCAFSQISQDNNYVKPELTEDTYMDITEGRHPVVEYYLKDALFVPNELHLNATDRRIMIITGPNMGGKSTYMRQVAVITIMAQIGCFVPAKSARIGIVDKIFTRVGASDDLASGQSTFMVEMNEVANVLKNATPKSLLILDEIGRGTSTLDGMSIARAVLEYLHNNKKIHAKTLFATHYHELCGMEDEFDSIVNYNVSVKKRGEEVVFLRKIVPGGADQSYGIEVAALAGVPKDVVKRAKQILDSLSGGQLVQKPKVTEPSNQFDLADISAREIVEELKKIDASTLTPIEAISKLYELSNRAKNEG